MKKGGFLRNVLDTIRSNQSQSASRSGHSGGVSDKGAEYGGQLKPQHFALGEVARHGFPESPSALAYDPVQKIAAVGTATGGMRVLGRPGVDLFAQHQSACAVTHIRFVVNQGAIITVTEDDCLHLWSLRGPNLKLIFASGGSTTGPSPSTTASPAPETSSSLGSSTTTGGSGSTATSPSSFLGQITDTVTGAVDSASDFLSGSTSGEPQSTPSPTLVGGDQTAQAARAFRRPELVQKLKFQREHITCIHQTLNSKWLYIGTERGNVHVASIETFELSGYSISWNKAVEISRKSHPGAIIHLSECPQDSNRLLIGYESGCIVVWDLKQRQADGRYYQRDNLLSLAWHHEGKQFVAAHGDGSLITWHLRSNTKPAQILYPHERPPSSVPAAPNNFVAGATQAFLRSQSDLYRPISKVEWKTSKSSNEQVILFSGGLPNDLINETLEINLESGNSAQTKTTTTSTTTGSAVPQRMPSTDLQAPLMRGASLAGTSPPPLSPPLPLLQQQASCVSPLDNNSDRPSPGAGKHQQLAGRKEKRSQQQQRGGTTSLTVMWGKSITVLDMPSRVVDFTCVCDSSPYENDASDPYAIIVLLHNELVLIDLKSPGYPRFESPYTETSLAESPVTSIQYVADCSTDLIPFLYSTSRNAVCRGPKRGFSDKEWPINGGEWGQSMQSYPELVLTGHQDGSIKFWDMSGINFDLISVIKTAKLFKRSEKPKENIVLTSSSASMSSTIDVSNANNSSNIQPCPSADNNSLLSFDARCYAINKIELCRRSKRLLAAGAASQVIQFKLNKKETQQPTAGCSGDQLATIIVEPTYSTSAGNGTDSGHTNHKRHLVIRVRDAPKIAGPPSGGPSTASTASGQRGAGFQAELVCLTPLLLGSGSPDQYASSIIRASDGAVTATSPSECNSFYCREPARITALVYEETHNILAYSHEFGIVLVDVIQKCLIMNASLSDLYGGMSMMSVASRDVSIQPFATSSILQHHYLATSSQQSGPVLADNASDCSKSNNKHFENGKNLATSDDYGRDDLTTSNDAASNSRQPTSGVATPNAGQYLSGATTGYNASGSGGASAGGTGSQVVHSRYTTSSMFQRQLSTNALNSGASGALAACSAQPMHHSRVSSAGGPRGLFQRQMTASQLFSGSTSGQQHSPGDITGKQSHLLANARVVADPSLARSAANLAAPDATGAAAGSKRATKNKRIISRMLSISAIHTNVGLNPPAWNAAADHHAAANATAASAVHDSLAADDANLTGATCSGPLPPNEAHPRQQRHKHRLQASGSGEHTLDKFSDSSFTRSRSSSSSSTTNHQQGQQHAGPLEPESIQCVAFLDPAQATPSAPGSLQQQPLSGAAQSSGSASGNSNHKSLSSIDANSCGQLALWLGTSHGTVLLVNLTLPDTEDNRILQLQSITAEPIPQASIKLPGELLSLSVFACESRHSPGIAGGAGESGPSGGASCGGGQLPSSGGQSSSLESSTSPLVGSNAAEIGSTTSSAHSPLSSCSSGSGVSGGGGGGASAPAGGPQSGHHHNSRSALFLALVSSKQACVYQVPAGAASWTPSAVHQPPAAAQHHHPSNTGSTSGPSSPPSQVAESPLCKLLVNKRNLISECELSDTSSAVCSQVVKWHAPDESCLVSYLATGELIVNPLPQLRPYLYSADFVPYANKLIKHSMRFSNNGHALYQPSAGEVSKFTLSANYKTLVNDMLGLAYVAREMPEEPRSNFFKSLFGASQSSKRSDRDDLFGEGASGKAARNVAQHVGGSSVSSTGAPASNERLKHAAQGTMGYEMRMAREGLDERGEKLSDMEDRTLAMLNQSENYSKAAHDLAQKFKDKKWYQF